MKVRDLLFMNRAVFTLTVIGLQHTRIISHSDVFSDLAVFPCKILPAFRTLTFYVL